MTGVTRRIISSTAVEEQPLRVGGPQRHLVRVLEEEAHHVAADRSCGFHSRSDEKLEIDADLLIRELAALDVRCEQV
jgi:hypothetical protein